MSHDYQLYNLIGFFCYSVFNCAFFFNKSIQEEYQKANNGHSNQVQVNDVFFALHALLLTVVIVAQIFLYDRDTKGSAGRITMFASVLTGGTFGLIVLYAILILAGIQSGELFTWLNWLYTLSYVKLGVTLIKYIPQVYLNWLRGTTDGFNMHNVLLDFTGGSLSVAQLLLDSGITSDWTAVTGDLAKFMLGFVSVVFDIVFMLQHYCCFHARNRELLQRRLVLERAHGPREASRLLAQEEIQTLISMKSVRGSPREGDAMGPGVALTGGYASTEQHEGDELLVGGEDTAGLGRDTAGGLA
jgi:cystinosin